MGRTSTIDQFVGSVISGGDASELDVARQINSAKCAFAVLFKIWKSNYRNTYVKLRLFRVSIISVLSIK